MVSAYRKPMQLLEKSYALRVTNSPHMWVRCVWDTTVIESDIKLSGAVSRLAYNPPLITLPYRSKPILDTLNSAQTKQFLYRTPQWIQSASAISCQSETQDEAKVAWLSISQTSQTGPSWSQHSTMSCELTT